MLARTLVLLVLCVPGHSIFAQDTPPKTTDTIRGTVINSVTQKPIGRALVFSPDNRFATMTDDHGVFEFAVPSMEMDAAEALTMASAGGVDRRLISNRPFALTARKPGFLAESNNEWQNRILDTSGKEIAITLIPEALIMGHVTLPSSQPPDPIQVEIYRRDVREGRGTWTSAGMTYTRSNGEFRFAELPAGTYKVITHELLDRDPQFSTQGGQLYGYPPVYYAKAVDFSTATPIQLTPGKIYHSELTLLRQPYYRIKISVANASPGSPINISVSAQGRSGPGFSLGYNQRDQCVEGLLPNGTYKVEATSYGPQSGGGTLAINVNGPLNGQQMTVLPSPPIVVNLKEEFTISNDQAEGPQGNGAANAPPRSSHLNIALEPVDAFDQGQTASMRQPAGPGDHDLLLENVHPGRYWVRPYPGRGYIASLTSGGVDLLQQPLEIPIGAELAPIEATVRDDFAEIEATIEGEPAATNALYPAVGAVGQPSMPTAHVYCIPMPDSSGQFGEMNFIGEGKYSANTLVPGVYHLLAFRQAQTTLEYRDPEAMRLYENKGQVVRVAGGAKEKVQLSVIPASE